MHFYYSDSWEMTRKTRGDKRDGEQETPQVCFWTWNTDVVVMWHVSKSTAGYLGTLEIICTSDKRI